MTVAATYWVGEPIVLRVQWTNNDPTSPAFGTVVQPATTAVATGPSETEQSLSVSGPDASGFFTARVTPDVPGQWWYGFTATGSYQGYAEASFLVAARRA